MDAAFVLIAVVFEIASTLSRVAILVAGHDQLLQLQFLEIMREVVKEIADLGIVAIAQDGLVFEIVCVMPQLFLDVGKLRIKLIILRRLCSVQFSI